MQQGKTSKHQAVGKGTQDGSPPQKKTRLSPIQNAAAFLLLFPVQRPDLPSALNLYSESIYIHLFNKK